MSDINEVVRQRKEYAIQLASVILIFFRIMVVLQNEKEK